MDAKLYNGLSLAYIGDAIYEVYIRKYVLSLGLTKVNDLHKKVIEFTCAKAQAKTVDYLLDNNWLKAEEIDIYKRGRNSHIHTTRRNVDLAIYLEATGFEAIIGYLHLNGNEERLHEIVLQSIKINEEV